MIRRLAEKLGGVATKKPPRLAKIVILRIALTSDK